MTIGVGLRALAIAAFGAVAAMSAPSARAESAADEIRLLKARLKQPEEKLARLQHIETEARVKAKKTVSAPAAPAPILAGALPGPDRFYFKGLQIIPGGFLAFETIHRSRWMGTDNNTPYQKFLTASFPAVTPTSSA